MCITDKIGCLLAASWDGTASLPLGSTYDNVNSNQGPCFLFFYLFFIFLIIIIFIVADFVIH